MQKRLCSILLILSLTMPVGLTGCATTDQSAGAGALAGAALGALISNDAAAGAAVGAVLGATVGYVVHKAQARKVQSAEATKDKLGYAAHKGLQLRMNRGTVSPVSVTPDSEVTAVMEYALLGTGGGKPVEERRILKRDGEVVAELQSERVVRTDGTWENELGFKVPPSAPAGRYVVVQEIEADDAKSTRNSYFNVVDQNAAVDEQRGLQELKMAFLSTAGPQIEAR